MPGLELEQRLARPRPARRPQRALRPSCRWSDRLPAPSTADRRATSGRQRRLMNSRSARGIRQCGQYFLKRLTLALTLELFHSDSPTILNVVWAPMMTVMPHNHPHVGCDRHLYRPRGQHFPGGVFADRQTRSKPWVPRHFPSRRRTLGTDIIHSVSIGSPARFTSMVETCLGLNEANGIR